MDEQRLSRNILLTEPERLAIGAKLNKFFSPFILTPSLLIMPYLQ